MDKKPHSKHKHLTGEHKFGDIGQIIIFIVFAGVWITDVFIFHYFDFLVEYVPIYVRAPIALAILFYSVYLILASHKLIFNENDNEPTVVRQGVYLQVRHPMYLSSLTLYLGLTLYTLSICSAIIFIAGFIFYHQIASYEEKLLIERFGDEYRKYQSEVPMWVPWTK